MMWENIPQELKFDALWCCWKLTEKGKLPYDAKTGLLAKSNDCKTFHSFKTILNKVQDYIKYDKDNRVLGGIGLGIFNGFSAIDIDHCIDENGVISDMAQDIIDYCQSYTETSPSGKGIRIIFKTDLKKLDKTKYYTNNAKIGLEVYIEGATNKFVTITGNVMLPANVAEVNIQYILDKYMLKNKQQINNDSGASSNVNVDYDIIDFLEKDPKLNTLWYSQASGSHGNESETDLALCSKLAFYAQRDYDTIANWFESSPYFASKDEQHKKKWLQRADYKMQTINTAISGCQSVYTPKKITKITNQRYGLNDTGNAHRFIDKFGEVLKYNKDNNCWMMWNGNYWQPDVFLNIKNYAELLIEEMKMEAFRIEDLDERKTYLKNVNRMFNSSGKEAMLKEAQHITNVPVINAMFDTDDYLFNCKDGIVDLRTGNLLGVDKNRLISKYSDVSYYMKEPPLTFLNFLSQIFEGNRDIINYVQKALGYSITGSMREQKVFFCVGDGSNGKSLLLQIINEIMADYGATSSVDILLDKKTQNANLSEIARLQNKRYVITGETKIGDKLDESALKSLSAGNDKITARFLYCNEFEFYPKMKIWMATNHKPIIRGTDNGIWRRLVIIPFNRIFKEHEQDKDLIDKLRKEKDGIFMWLIEGCLKWQKEGLDNMPQVLIDELKEYRKEMDLVARWIDECCVINPTSICKASDLFENFSDYCSKNKEFPMSQTLFGRNFGKKFNKKRNNGVTVYEGVSLKGGYL